MTADPGLGSESESSVNTESIRPASARPATVDTDFRKGMRNNDPMLWPGAPTPEPGAEETLDNDMFQR